MLALLPGCSSPEPAPLPADVGQATRTLTSRFQSGQVLDALRQAEALVMSSDGAPEAQRVLAMMFTQLEWPDQGVLAFDRIVAARPGDARARLHRAEMLLAFPARRQERIDELRRALALDPALLEARLALARDLAGAGRFDEARAEVDAARAEGGAGIDATRTLALIETKAGRPAEAERVLRAELEVHPANQALETALARALMEQERYDEAEPILVRLAQRYPRNDFAAIRRARLALRKGDLDAVREVIDGLAAGRVGGGPIP